MIASPVLIWIIYTWVFYGMFLIYCAVQRARDAGAFQKAPRLVQLVAYSYMFPAYVADVVFNLFPLLGPIVFLESPLAHVEWTWTGLTFTHRCRWHKLNGNGWRQQRGREICDSGLDPFDPGHC